MGELHLDIYVERMKREYNVPCVTGKPRVAFRETVTELSKFDYIHKKQTGGSGQYGRVKGTIEPMEIDPDTGKDTAFENRVVGGNVPIQFIPAVEKVRFLCMRTISFLLMSDVIGFPRGAGSRPVDRSPDHWMSLRP